MSYAIIRNEKYKRANLKGIYRHNERKNTNYSNKNIDKERTHLNYHLKQPENSYEKEFEVIRKEYDLKGQIKEVSNIVCEYIITSDKEFFVFIVFKATKRYFKTAYDFVCQYKGLGEQYILSAVVHMDEETPHMHLVFIPVVHTINKQGQEIDKVACSEFWKVKDSYRRLQDAFYKCVTENGFELERGTTSEREHFSVKAYKEITNFENTKTTLKDIKMEVPQVPNITDFSKLTIKRNEKIQKNIIEPKDNLISKLYEDNKKLHKQLEKQVAIIDKAEKYEKEGELLTQRVQNLELKCITLERKYKKEIDEIGEQYEYEKEELERSFDKKYKKLEKQNKFLQKIIEKTEENVKIFVKWFCRKFKVSESESVMENFERDTGIDIFAQEAKIEKENVMEMEL